MATNSKATTDLPGEPELREMIAKLIGSPPEDVPPDVNLILLGLTSIEIMRMVGRWRRAGFPVAFEELASAPTLSDWLAYLDSLRAR
ncbi:hypothetical protein, putative Phosphopantetheine-binding domain [Frankia alni ACN14a]|uniref:Carrier domain-containing protein n=2 Tax=Frankiaceae TaxID=74712 RepID=Q0RGU7_FRAAA|nr:hypothetical protein, putative Phosphopantetheine-binding domain [Frankia alni ACN14a]